MNINDGNNLDYIEDIAEIVKQAIANNEIREHYKNYHNNDIANALPELTDEERKKLYHGLEEDELSDIFSYVEDASEYFSEMELEKAAGILENMDSDDAVDILEDVDENLQEKLVSLMDDESSRDIKLIQSYEDDEIGSMMTTNFIEISKELTVKQAMRELIAQAEDNDNIMTIYVCDERKKYYGVIELKDLITAREYTELSTLISTSYPYVMDHDNLSDCLERIKEYAEDSIPVLNRDHEVIGVITSQDIIEAVDDEMGDDYAKLAGLTEEEDLKEPLLESMKKRMPWLIALLLLGLGVSAVVGVFEGVVSQVAIIVCFQSLILDMAGNVGTQSLAVTIRVLMDEDLAGKQKFKFVLKEVRVGFFNGLILGIFSFIAIGFYIMILKGYPPMFSFAVSGSVGIALLVAMIISSLVGTVIPMFFHKINVDPAVASGPLITTVNDFVAVLTYYGLAWFLLIHVLQFA